GPAGRGFADRRDATVVQGAQPRAERLSHPRRGTGRWLVGPAGRPQLAQRDDRRLPGRRAPPRTGGRGGAPERRDDGAPGRRGALRLRGRLMAQLADTAPPELPGFDYAHFIESGGYSRVYAYR